MNRYRGFSLIEIMLALVVIGIGISLILTFSSNTRQQTHGQASGNDYSVITNSILEQFVADIQKCNKNIPAGDCPIQTQFTNTQTMSAYDYLCGNTSSSTSLSTCTNGKISSSQYQNLKTSGLDLLKTTVALSPDASDTEN